MSDADQDLKWPLYILMHGADNVAIVANDGGLPAGTVFPSGLTLRDKVPQGHKLALVDIAAGDPVIRYNVAIGFATQYIAAKFQYQPALGPPLLQTKSGGVYQPFSWMIWGWHYATSQDIRIRRPFFEGEMIVLAGSFLCVGVFFAITNRRTRKRRARGRKPPVSACQ